MSQQGAAHEPEHRSAEILTDVAKARVSRPEEIVKKLRVFTEVEGVDFCDVDLIQARAENDKHGWDVNALFRVTVGVDTKRGDRVLRTLAFFKTHVPYPVEDCPFVDFRKLESRVEIHDIVCSTSVGPEEHCLVVQATFRLVLYALKDEVIEVVTVCRLPGPQ